jgi:shikimate kinase
MKKNIVLTGMPAAGKSTVGVILAKYTNMDFLDTDILIQQKTGKRLFEIMESSGVDEFCQIEENTVSEIDTQSCVIATGGSVVYSVKAMENLKKNGIIVWLKISPEQVEKRLKNLNQRGVVHKKGETVLDIYSQRLPLYEKWADISIDSGENRPEDVVNFIIKELALRD